MKQCGQRLQWASTGCPTSDDDEVVGGEGGGGGWILSSEKSIKFADCIILLYTFSSLLDGGAQLFIFIFELQKYLAFFICGRASIIIFFLGAALQQIKLLKENDGILFLNSLRLTLINLDCWFSSFCISAKSEVFLDNI